MIVESYLRAELVGALMAYCDGEKLIETAVKKIGCM
jgi:hypothetical protein